VSDKLAVHRQRIEAAHQRTKDAADRVRSKHEEIAKLEADGRSSAKARAVLAFLERELATHCETLEMLLQHAEQYLKGSGLSDQ
jgi:uncharacterized protein Smg (DUF494 family)